MRTKVRKSSKYSRVANMAVGYVINNKLKKNQHNKELASKQ